MRFEGGQEKERGAKAGKTLNTEDTEKSGRTRRRRGGRLWVRSLLDAFGGWVARRTADRGKSAARICESRDRSRFAHGNHRFLGPASWPRFQCPVIRLVGSWGRKAPNATVSDQCSTAYSILLADSPSEAVQHGRGFEVKRRFSFRWYCSLYDYLSDGASQRHSYVFQSSCVATAATNSPRSDQLYAEVCTPAH
jgi:hypothetical protein